MLLKSVMNCRPTPFRILCCSFSGKWLQDPVSVTSYQSEQPFGSINHVVVHLPARLRHSNSGSPFHDTPPWSEQLNQWNPSYGFHPVCLIGPIIHFQYKPFSHMTFVSIISLLSDGSALLFHHGLGSRGGLWVTWSNSIMMTDARSPGSTPPALLHSFIPLLIHFMVGGVERA